MLKHLVVIRLKSMFAGFFGRSKKGNSTGKVILFGILLLYIVVVFGALFINLFSAAYDAFTALDMAWLYFGLAGVMVFVLCFVGSVFVTQQQLFEAKDNDLLLSMPVPVKYILASRLLSIVVLNYIYEILVMGPAVGVYLYKGNVNPLGLLFTVLAVLILPLLVLTFSALFGWIIALIDSKIGKKNLIMMVLTLILLLAYLYICLQLQDYIAMLVENGAAIGEAIEKALPPFYYMGLAGAEGDIAAFLLFIVFCIVPFAAVYFALDRSFIKIATANKGRRKIAYREKTLKASGIKTALLMKDMRHFAGNPMYIFNAAIGLLFMAIGAVYLFIKADDIAVFGEIFAQMTGDESILGAGLAAGMTMMISLVCISAPMISIEAKTLWISKSLPVRAKDVLFAKANVHILSCMPFILLCGVLLEFAFDMSLLSRVLVIALPTAAAAFHGYMGLVLNLAYPKFDWLNEIDAVKQGMAPTLAVLISMATVVLPVLLYGVFLRDVMTAEVYAAGVFLLFAAAAAVLNRYLATKGVEKFEAL